MALDQYKQCSDGKMTLVLYDALPHNVDIRCKSMMENILYAEVVEKPATPYK